jgi:hypothetical protein
LACISDTRRGPTGRRGEAPPFGDASFGITASNPSRYHCRPSPCDRLSRPRSTTTAPPRPRPISRRSAQPYGHAGCAAQGQTRNGSRVHSLIAQRRRHPTRPLRHRYGYPAALHRSLPSTKRKASGSSPPHHQKMAGIGCASPPTPIRQVRAGVILRGVNAGSSRMPFRHAHRARPIWQC